MRKGGIALPVAVGTLSKVNESRKSTAESVDPSWSSQMAYDTAHKMGASRGLPRTIRPSGYTRCFLAGSSDVLSHNSWIKQLHRQVLDP